MAERMTTHHLSTRNRNDLLLVAVVEHEPKDASHVVLTKVRVYRRNKNENDLSAHDLYKKLVKAFCDDGDETNNNNNDKNNRSLDDYPQLSMAIPSMQNIQVYDLSSQQYISLADCCFEEKSILQRFGRRLRIRIIPSDERTTETTTKADSNMEMLAIAGRYYEFDGCLAIAGNDNNIRIQQDSNRCHAGTAINVWDGAILLARYLELAATTEKTTTTMTTTTPSNGLANGNVQGLVVLELGAGCGLAGIAAAVLGAQVVILTDLPGELERLHRNITANQALWSQETTVVTCQACDWYNPPELSDLLASVVSMSSSSTPAAAAVSTLDFILVADCVWMEELVEPLFSTLRRYTTKETRVLITYQRRGKATDQAFWSALHEAFGSVEELHPPGLYMPDVFHLLSCQQCKS